MLERTPAGVPMEPAAPVGPAQAQRTDRGADRAIDDPRALQILTTEHWSLLATRSLTWNEAFSRAGMFLSSLSAAVVALALVAQATDFRDGFILFAIVILPFVLFIGLTTFVRLSGANLEDVYWVAGMNRIRHAYHDIAPGLSDYFITGSTDDERGIMTTLGAGPDQPFISPLQFIVHGLTTTPGMVGTINAMVAAVLGGLVAVQLGLATPGALVTGAATFVVVLGAEVWYGVREAARLRSMQSRFPSPTEGSEGP